MREGIMTKTSKPVGSMRTAEIRDLNENELDVVSGGGMLSSAVSQTVKTFGQALQTAARG
jgi:hypothetical protein